jgi:hypothetical protein
VLSVPVALLLLLLIVVVVVVTVVAVPLSKLQVMVVLPMLRSNQLMFVMSLVNPVAKYLALLAMDR